MSVQLPTAYYSLKTKLMDRREALQTVALIMGGTIVGAQAILTAACGPTEPEYNGLLTENNYEAWVEEVAETILPRTERTPGAKDAGVGRFMNVIVTECYDEREQQTFLQGITSLNDRSREVYGKTFDRIKPQERHDLLLIMEDESTDYNSDRVEGTPPHYYTMMKQLSLIGFLTSEVGMTQAMRHVSIPGRYDPCVPYEEGEKAWVG